ncbi:MAG: SprT family zinc-dependent metalloprotease [Alphaproteobacteria bacterium]
MVLIPLDLTEKTIFVQWKPSARSRTIRLTIRNTVVTLTSPMGTPQTVLKHFLNDKKIWIEKHINSVQHFQFEYDQTIEIFGMPYLLKHDPLRHKKVKKDQGILWIGGKPEQLRHMLVTFLKEEAEVFFEKMSREYATELGVSFQRITIRDARTRWGSCSSQGALNFNWRLTLAPFEVASYIAAHEVAHLKEMNHSPKFWKLVEQLDPHYKKAKHWLKTNEKNLMGH